MIFWIAQIFGILGLLAMLISLFQKEKTKMLFFVIFNGLFFSVEYLLLGAWAGMLSNMFGILRTFTFMKKETNPNIDKIWVLISFICAYIIIGIISFDGKIISLLPIIAEIIYILVLWQESVKVIRLGTLIMVILWLIYDLIMMAYPSAITDLIVLITTIIAIFVNDVKISRTNY